MILNVLTVIVLATMQMNADRNVLPVFHLVVDEIETLDMLSSAGGFQDYDERNEFIQMLMEKEKKKTLEEKEEKLKKQFSEIIKGEIDQLKKKLESLRTKTRTRKKSNK